MKWEKKGIIYSPDGEKGWRNNSFSTPTPFLLNDGVIRIYGSFRDEEGIGRIGYVDVEAANPSKIISVSKNPVLDIGEPGMFDDNGVILGDILKVDEKIYMYYVGFQLVKRVKFFAFSGLAISHDGGNSFLRVKKTPIIDRTEKAPFIRAIHSIMYDDGIFKCWYAADKGWQYIDCKPYPSYNIWYMESKDGLNFSPNDNIMCIDTQGSEYRIGRPRVYKTKEKYIMLYTRDFIERNYIAGYAESNEGINWNRIDQNVGIEKSRTGWDSEMCCYPSLFRHDNKIYAFYNGNGFGKTGFGYAELINGEEIL
jgi:predicted GH43/DUF377 family glycosyl hydrolase